MRRVLIIAQFLPGGLAHGDDAEGGISGAGLSEGVNNHQGLAVVGLADGGPVFFGFAVRPIVHRHRERIVKHGAGQGKGHLVYTFGVRDARLFMDASGRSDLIAY